MFSWQKYWNPLQTLIKVPFLVGHFFTRIYLRYPWLFATLDKGDEYDDGDDGDEDEGDDDDEGNGYFHHGFPPPLVAAVSAGLPDKIIIMIMLKIHM